MKQNVDLVKFNLTPTMTEELIKFNNLKKELIKLKNKKILTNKENKEIIKLENKLFESRKKFINDFRKNNKEEILEYLRLKDQNWSFFLFLKGFLIFIENNIYEGKKIF